MIFPKVETKRTSKRVQPKDVDVMMGMMRSLHWSGTNACAKMGQPFLARQGLHQVFSQEGGSGQRDQFVRNQSP
jgi:hypothetical protein